MKEIPLTNSNKVAFVDDDDYENVVRFKWMISKNNSVLRTTIVKDERPYLHQFLMGRTFIDHKDRNPLNNTRHNLRFSTQSQNCANTIKRNKEFTSIYKGVYWAKTRNKWIAQIKIDRKAIRIGGFNSEIEAAKAYDKKALELFGEFAVLNFL